jgi:hypothetical protein
VFTKLLGLNYRIIYKKGVDNTIVDVLGMQDEGHRDSRARAHPHSCFLSRPSRKNIRDASSPILQGGDQLCGEALAHPRRRVSGATGRRVEESFWCQTSRRIEGRHWDHQRVEGPVQDDVARGTRVMFSFVGRGNICKSQSIVMIT